jgi:hypothetical protein
MRLRDYLFRIVAAFTRFDFGVRIAADSNPDPDCSPENDKSQRNSVAMVKFRHRTVKEKKAACKVHF